MWTYKDKVFEPSFEEIQDNEWIGFVYIVTEKESGKKYIGKKSFISKVTKPPLKGKKRKRRSIKESDWKTYCGSSEIVKQIVEDNGVDYFDREILHLCKSKGELSYKELKEQIDREVLLRDDYHNGIIQCRINSIHIKDLHLYK